jgi:hypothetical protein
MWRAASLLFLPRCHCSSWPAGELEGYFCREDDLSRRYFDSIRRVGQPYPGCRSFALVLRFKHGSAELIRSPFCCDQVVETSNTVSKGSMPRRQQACRSRRRFVMKIRITAIIFSFVFALATFSWAQTATPSNPNPAQPSTASAPAEIKADCPCCQKMADSKVTESCCAHHQNGSAKSEASCCKGTDGRDAMSCMKGDTDKSADACCSKGQCVDKGKEGCCSKSDKTTEQAAIACCGANGEHCGMAHHEHADINK